MIYTINEARNVEEYRAEKAAREKAEQDKKDKQYSDRYYHKNKEEHGFVSKYRTNGHADVYNTKNVGDRNRGVGPNIGLTFHILDDEDAHRRVSAHRVANRNTKSSKEQHEFRDAANRNMRRHPERWDGDKPIKPKSESTIFDNIEIV